MLVAAFGQRRRDDGFAEVFAHGAHGLGHAHAGSRGLSGFDDGRGVELVLDLEDLSKACDLVCLEKGVSVRNGRMGHTHLEFDCVDDLFEVFSQDVALDRERTGTFVLVCKIGVDATGRAGRGQRRRQRNEERTHAR